MTKRRQESEDVDRTPDRSVSITGHLFGIASLAFSSSFDSSDFVIRLFRLTAILLTLSTGCITSHPNAIPVTKVDEKQNQPDYWWNQPAVVHVSAPDFFKLWDACKGELYVRLFPIDRQQYREGLLTSEPVISKQFFEPWRTDAVTVHDVAESSLATLRRTIRFEVARVPDGTFEMTPKVLVERFQSTERRLTAINQYHSSFSAARAYNDAPDESGAPAAADYWYPVRRDSALEKDLAAAIRRRINE